MADEELKYPLEWTFRIVVVKASAEDVRREVAVVAEKYDVPCELSDGLVSSNGSYVTIKFPVVVRDRDMFVGIGDDLGAIKGVKYLL